MHTPRTSRPTTPRTATPRSRRRRKPPSTRTAPSRQPPCTPTTTPTTRPSPRHWPGHGRGTRRRRSTSPASPVSPPNSRSGPRPWPPARSRDLPAFADVTTARRARLPVDRRRRDGLRALHQRRLHRRRLVPRPEPAGVARVPGRRRASARSCRRCSSPRTSPIDDPELVDYGGPLMQWHVHENLCWSLDENGKPKVVGVTDADGKCAPGSVNAGGENPMVHVWIAPHECGPFAALEGHGAGQAATRRRSAPTSAPTTTATSRREAAARPPPPTTRPSRSTCPASPASRPSSRRTPRTSSPSRSCGLPQWSDPAVAEAAGFHSIGDARNGPRALHQLGLDRRRRVARPRRAREPRLRAAARRLEEARVGDVHAADSRSPSPTSPTGAAR